MKRNRFSNSAAIAGLSGALNAGDRGSYQYIPDNTGNPYQFTNYIERWKQYVKMYELTWEARKIVNIPVEDALRKEWDVEGVGDGILEVLRKEEDKFGFVKGLDRALKLERLLGGSIQFLGLEDSKDDPAKPYDPKYDRQRLRFINTIPISRIARTEWDNNPLSPHFMRPTEYLINGQTVHRTRCIVWDGEPLFDPMDFALVQFRANLSGFGPSKLAPLWDDIVKAVGTRQAAYQLIQTNNALIVMVQELQDLMSTNPGRANAAKIKEIANSLSVYRAALIQKDKVEVSQHSASFGSVPELLILYLQVLSAASDIPATRFLGQSPGGLNATGESDLENYYNAIDAYQHKRIVPAIQYFYDIIGYQKWPDSWERIRDKIEIKFPPLWNLSELEEAQKNQIELANVMQVWQEGLLSDEKAVEELNLKGIFSVELEEADIDVMKSFQDDADIMGLGQGNNPSEKGPNSAVGKTSGAGVGNPIGQPKEPVKTPLAKVPAPKKPALPKIGNKKITNTKYDTKQILAGMQVEMEHGDVTGDDPVEIAKIVRAHLSEDPEYYSKLHKAMPDEPDPDSEKIENKGNFEESEHPRAEDGRFGSKPGDGAKVEKKTKKSDEQKKQEANDKFQRSIEHHTEVDKHAHIEARNRGLAVPPAWSNVWVNPDKHADLQVRGVDAKGRTCRLYSVTAKNRNAAQKFTRLKGFAKAHPQMMRQVEGDFSSSPEAQVLYLINKTGFRIGGEKDTGADVQAYGASTLKPEHVKVEGSKVTFNFTGKKGVRQSHTVDDSKLASVIQNNMDKERIFDTSPEKVRNYLHKIAGKEYKVKDFRTYVATAEALKAIKGMEAPKDEKAKTKAIMEVAKKVSQKLGNTPIMARDSYIDPTVWQQWQVKNG